MQSTPSGTAAYVKSVRLPMLSGIVPTRLLLGRLRFVTPLALHVSPNHSGEHGVPALLPQLLLFTQLQPAVATYRSISASRPGKSQDTGRPITAPDMPGRANNHSVYQSLTERAKPTPPFTQPASPWL